MTTALVRALFPILIIPIAGIAAGTAESARELLEAGRGAEAAALLQNLAADGNADAQVQLGLLYYEGRGVAADETRAFALFERAAATGRTDAMFLLGRMCLLGHGPARQDADADRNAARWFFEAARRGHADAQYHLGLLFYAGTGVVKDTDEALKWIRRAADSGHAGARQFFPSLAPPK